MGLSDRFRQLGKMVRHHETTGFMDMSISGSDNTNITDFGVKHVTSSSMPPPAQFNVEAQGASLLFGDYIYLATKGENCCVSMNIPVRKSD